MRAPLAASLLAVVAACSSAQPLEPGVRRHGTTWKTDVAPALSVSCGSCHSGDEPAAGLRTDDYQQVIARARAGDASSRLLAVRTDATHAPFTSAFKLLQTWVVDDDLGYETSAVHGAGLMNPSDPTFHGSVVRGQGWDLSTCAKCHGGDFAGGTSGVTCKTCHDGGPTACTGCHGQPPATGAHVVHAAKLDCVECHVKPALYTDAGHLHAGPGAVKFGALASTAPAAPTYDKASQTCSGVYCHGGAFTDSAATLRAPAWGGGPSQAACGTCHGLPPSGHQGKGDQCVSCHPSVVDGARHIVDAAKHVNGMVNLGAGDTCTSCHGQPPASGAHLGHVNAVHALAAPVACGDCHTVPATIDAAGHLTDRAAVKLTGVRATGDGQTQPSYDAATGTCSDVHCHGSAQPAWGAGLETIACGSCHGIPPATAPHTAELKLSDCVTCHAASVVDGGAIRIGGAHMNGVVDAQQ